jgi:O-antigen/teichoic acid export membrane protein
MEKNMVRNVAINFSGLVLPTFVSLVTVPAYIHLIGVDRYGVISLVWTLIGYFGILDLGMSMAAQHQISKAHAAGDPAQRTRVFWSAVWLNLATGIAGGLVIYFGAFVYTAWFAHSPPALQHEVYLALPWLAIAIPIANVSWVFAGAINGMERFGIYNTNQTIGTFLFQLLPLGAAWLIAANLQTVLAAAVLARLLAALMLARASFKVLAIRKVEWPQRGVANGLFKFGGWMLVSSMTSMVTDSLDRVLLGAHLGARFVTYYTVPQNLVTRLNMLPNALVRTLFPRLSAVNREDADGMVRTSLEFLNVVFTPIALFAMLVLAPFLHVWIGRDLAIESAPVGRVLIIGVWLVGQASVTRIMIQSQINPATAARIGLFQLPFFVAALWFGIARFGPIGAASVVVLRSLVDYAVLLWMSRIHARPIALDMLLHLAFLLVGLALGATIDAIANPLHAVATAMLLSSVNAAWSVATRPVLRSMVQTFGRDLSARLRRRVNLPVKARRDA